MSKLLDLKKEIKLKKNSKQAKNLQKFFKTGPGEYGEGDIFLGLKVGEQRKLSEKYKDLSFRDLKKLVRSKIHEERLVSLLILIQKFKNSEKTEKDKIYKFYLENTKHINNWDLVDLSAPKIMGEYLVDKPKNVLYKLASSANLWERRIAVMSNFYFIKNNDFKDALQISKRLLEDDRDLIHKAVGWMLREIGKKSLKTEERFLKKHYKKMPRTMLRYAIEKFPAKKRKLYLEGRI